MYSPVTHFYVFRHSETPRNASGNEIQGWIDDQDAQLNEKGIEAAHELGKGLAKTVPNASAIYSSDLARSYQTAEIVASYYERKPLIFKDPRAREKCHGKWDTLSPKIRNEYCLQYYKANEEELKSKNDRFAKWKIEPLSFGGIEPVLPDCQDVLESIFNVYERGTALFKELAEKHAGETLLISSHGAFNDTMASAAESLQTSDESLLPVYFEEKARHFPKNCAVYYFTWDSTQQKLNFVGERYPAKQRSFLSTSDAALK